MTAHRPPRGLTPRGLSYTSVLRILLRVRSRSSPCHDAQVTDWALLTDAYGRADEVPSLLIAAETGDPLAWEELWSRLCHQGSVSTASYAAIPHLSELALRSEPVGYNQALALAAAIVGSDDGPQDAEMVRRSYQPFVLAMHKAAEENLALARDDIAFIYALQALLAFDGVPIWKNHLESIADGEANLECPKCGQILLLTLDAADAQDQFTVDDPATQAIGASTAPNSLDPAQARMYSIAIAQQRPNVAAAMLRLFGRARCSRCGQAFDVSLAL